jgi:hypothetical protein
MVEQSSDRLPWHFNRRTRSFAGRQWQRRADISPCELRTVWFAFGGFAVVLLRPWMHSRTARHLAASTRNNAPAPPPRAGKGLSRVKLELWPNVVQAPQPLGDDVAKPL